MDKFRDIGLQRAEYTEYRGYTLEPVKEYPSLYRAMHDGKEAKALGWFVSTWEAEKAIDKFLTIQTVKKEKKTSAAQQST